MNDQDYINNIKEQIRNGIYYPLFKGKKDLVFLDIGANIGLVSEFARQYCKRIVAVEPSPGVFEVLKQKHYLEAVQAALTPTDGPHEFYINPINFTASSTVNTYGEKTTVMGLTLSSILSNCDLDHVDVVKCDSEGAEGESLSFQQLESASSIVDQWFIETHNCPKTDWNHKIGTLVAYLTKLGYVHQEINGMA